MEPTTNDNMKYSSRKLIDTLEANNEWTRAKDWLQHNGTYYETLLATPYFAKSDNAINEMFTGLQIELAWANDVRDARMQSCLVDTTDTLAEALATVADLTNQVTNLTQQVTALTNEVAGLRLTIEQEVTFLQEKATTLQSIAASYPRVATELNAVIASINQRIEELGGEPVSTEGGAGEMSEPVE